MKLFAVILIPFLFAILGLCFWKMLEPNKSVADILKEIKGVFTGDTDQPSVMPMYPGHYPLYEQHRVSYEDMGVSVRECMDKLSRKSHISIPEDPTKVHSPEIADRVKLIGKNRIMFVYEVQREPLFQGEKVSKIADSVIETALRSNLPTYLWGGYCYMGPVYAKDIGGGRLRIEVLGVDRQYQNPNTGGLSI